MMKQTRKEKRRDLKLGAVIGIIVLLLAVLIMNLFKSEELTPEPVLNSSQPMMEMEYFYYNLNDLVDYADEMNYTDERITEEFLQQCMDVGRCPIIFKEGLPLEKQR